MLTIAPTSEVAYQTEIMRAIRGGDEQGGVASARRAIVDDVDDRHDTFQIAVSHLLREAIRHGTIEEELAWLEANAPGIFDLEAEAVPQKYRRAQEAAFDAWYVALSREEVLRRLDLLLSADESIGVDPTLDPIVHLYILALRGDSQRAIEVALSAIFSRTVAVQLDWRAVFEQAQFAEVVADPRVQAAMQRWEEEEAALRGQVQTYLADLLAST